jgi:hypothetical protein
MNREFEIRREVELPGTPEQVFDAVATGNGTAGWMFPTGEGAPSAVGEEFAGHTVTALERPSHFAVRVEGEDGWFNSLDYRIERHGSGAILRYVHSGVMTGDWDTQYDGADRHTDFYLHSLGEYLAHFSGREVVYVGAEGPGDALGEEAFAAVRAALGIGGLRSDDALYRFYGRGRMGMPVFAGHHLFAPGADGEAAKAAWEAWLSEVIAGAPARSA